MSKADTLLKKATFFERMALYSDRRSFLQALGQETIPEVQITGDPNAENKSIANQALQLLQQLGISDDQTRALGNAVIFNKVDVPAMRREIQNAIYTGGISPLSHQREIDQLKQLSTSLKAPASPTDSSSQVAGGTTPPASRPAGGGGGSINPADQKAVFQFAIEQGELVPDPEKQKADGVLGNETRKALEGVKNYFAKKNPQNKRMSDQEAINAAKFKGR